MNCALLLMASLSVAGAAPLNEPIQELNSELINSGSLADLRWPDFTRIQADVARFYELNGHRLAWISAGAITPQARALTGVLENAGSKGLDPEDYNGSRWRAPQADAGRFDLALTVSAMRYISDVSSGKVSPEVFSFGLRFSAKKYDLAASLRTVMSARDVAAELERLEPPFEGYWRTQKALADYVTLARQDTDPPGLPRVERLLRLVGDLGPNDSLADGVKRFQIRYGLNPDGRIGKDTLQQLNTPLARRVRQLQLVLERWRWVPHSFPRPPIVVNIPEFRLRAYDARYRPELEMKVVVGKAYRHKTPVFSDEMTNVIIPNISLTTDTRL